MRRRTVAILSSILATGAAVALVVVRASPARGSAAAAERLVAVDRVDLVALDRSLAFSGVVRADRRAKLAFTVSARLMKRPVDVGDRVRRGDLLAIVDRAAYSNALQAAEADLERAKTNASQLALDEKRSSRLFSSNAAGREEVEKVRTGLRATRAAVAAAEAQVSETKRLLRETRLVAPFEGVVTSVHLEPGEIAAPGRPVVVISAVDELEVEVEVPESARAWAKEGREVDVALPFAEGVEIRGEVVSIGSAAEGPGRLFPLVVRLPAHERLAPGTTAQVRLSPPERRSLTVPVSAVVDPSGRAPAVFCVREGRAVRVPIVVAGLHGERVGVSGALMDGEPVVVGGHSNLVDGDVVRVRP